MNSTEATKVEWKTQRRGGYTNYVAEVYGIRLAVFRPTPEADFVLAIDHVDQPGTHATAAAARKAAEAIVAGWDAIANEYPAKPEPEPSPADRGFTEGFIGEVMTSNGAVAMYFRTREAAQANTPAGFYGCWIPAGADVYEDTLGAEEARAAGRLECATCGEGNHTTAEHASLLDAFPEEDD